MAEAIELEPRSDPSTTGSPELAIEAINLRFEYTRNFFTLFIDPATYLRSQKSATTVLENVSLAVPKGHIYSLLGSSGCGKTTLLKCILTRLQPSSGSLRIFGASPRFASIPGPGVGFMPQELALCTAFSIRETFQYFGKLYGMSIADIYLQEVYFIAFLNLPKATTTIASLSGGQQRRVSLAAALLHRPPLMILDEPTVGVDPQLRVAIWTFLESLCRDAGTSILITTHYIEEARRAHTIGLLRNGRLLTEGNPETLLREHRLDRLEELFFKLSVEQDAQKGAGAVQVQRSRESKQINKENSNTPQHSNSILTFDRSRFVALFTKDCLNYRRNLLMTLFFTLIPTLTMITFLMSSNSTLRDISVAVINDEQQQFLMTEAKEPSELHLLSETYLNLLHSITIKQHQLNWTLDEVLPHWETNVPWTALLHFPGNFTEALEERRLDQADAENSTILASNVHLYLDMSNPILGFTVLYHTLLTYQDLLQSYLSSLHLNPMTMSPPLDYHLVYGELALSTTFQMLPGYILISIFFSITANATLSLIVDQKDGLVERSVVAGVQPLEVLLAQAASKTLFLLMVLVSQFVFLFAIYGIESKGSIALLFSFAFVQGLAGIMFGLVVGSICLAEFYAMIGLFSLMLPSLLVCGVFWPFEALPETLKPFRYLFPQAYAIEPFKSIMFRGWSLAQSQVAIGMAASVLCVVVFFLIALGAFRKFI